MTIPGFWGACVISKGPLPVLKNRGSSGLWCRIDITAVVRLRLRPAWDILRRGARVWRHGADIGLLSGLGWSDSILCQVLRSEKRVVVGVEDRLLAPGMLLLVVAPSSIEVQIQIQRRARRDAGSLGLPRRVIWKAVGCQPKAGWCPATHIAKVERLDREEGQRAWWSCGLEA